MNQFGPTADFAALRLRADVLNNIRQYFADNRILEVDVPVLAEHSVTDVHLSALSVSVMGQVQYLQTSPEYYMKRLLAAGSGSIYTMIKAFRADEKGQRHRPEFSMLEWYRTDIDDRQLMQDVMSLAAQVGVVEPFKQISYRELFLSHTDINPHTAKTSELASYCDRHFGIDWPNTPRGTWLDVIFSRHVEPQLQLPTLVYDFPACQCALARVMLNDQNESIARRFEWYWQGLELANGYWELSDANEQRQRFEQDNDTRAEQQLPSVKMDPHFLAAMEHGLPDCAGIALGIDRLMMCLFKTRDIAKVITFG